MTLTCAMQGTAPDGGPTCPFCRGEACNACLREGIVQVCPHDPEERHRGMVPIDDDRPLKSRTTTAKIPPMTADIAVRVDLADHDAAADFLHGAANLLRMGGVYEIIIRRVR